MCPQKPNFLIQSINPPCFKKYIKSNILAPFPSFHISFTIAYITNGSLIVRSATVPTPSPKAIYSTSFNMDEDIATFLAFTATEDSATAKQFLDISGGNVEYAVQLFMESGNQPLASNNDEELAQRLQLEAYENNSVREADANVHRHETLLDSFPPYHGGFEHHENAIFGSGRVGVFNQRYDDGQSDDDDSDPQIIELDSDSEDENDVMEVDEGGEPVRLNRRTRTQRSRDDELTSTQRRLAELFKPPFDLILRTSLDGAKTAGRKEQKWILVNIQDQSEFQCQVLNRDFWSNAAVKEIVKKNFILLQYQHDSPHGQNYLNFYTVDGFPHISILDPMTGERVRTWVDGMVPALNDWVADVELFLEKFSLQPGSSNPLVEHKTRFDPDAMTEEQQIEYAMKQSMAKQEAEAEQEVAHEEPEDTSIPEDPFAAIAVLDHTEPTSGPTTRIQIRFPNGKRLIHKFNPEADTVRHIYQWLKFTLSAADESAYGIGSDAFSISCAGKPKLLDCIDETIEHVGLKNASILVESQ